MKKDSYLRPGNLQEWTGKVLLGLEASRGGTKIPALDASAALLLLDPQKIFVSGDSPAFIPGWKAVGGNCLALLKHAAGMGRLSVVTRHIHPPEDSGGSILHFFGRLIRDADPLSAVADDMGCLREAHVMTKSRHSAFSNDRLDGMLRERDIKTVVIGGVQADLCVLATAVEAGTRDFIPVVAADATAAGSERQHVAVLEALAGGLACVMSTREIIEQWH
ncbi:MAG: cysteine hydrolase [Pseudomonadota bacterium]